MRILQLGKLTAITSDFVAQGTGQMSHDWHTIRLSPYRPNSHAVLQFEELDRVHRYVTSADEKRTGSRNISRTLESVGFK